MAEKILPCPFCGSNQVSVVSSPSFGCFVTCDDCCAVGPIINHGNTQKANQTEAVEKWNVASNVPTKKNVDVLSKGMLDAIDEFVEATCDFSVAFSMDGGVSTPRSVIDDYHKAKEKFIEAIITEKKKQSIDLGIVEENKK